MISVQYVVGISLSEARLGIQINQFLGADEHSQCLMQLLVLWESAKSFYESSSQFFCVQELRFIQVLLDDGPVILILLSLEPSAHAGS